MRELDIVIDSDWFKHWKHSYYPQTRTDIRSITSLYSPYLLDDSEKFSNGSYTTALTFGTFMNEKKKNCIILFSVFPPTVLNPEQVVKHAKNLCCNYMNNNSIQIEGISPSYMILPSDEARNSLVSQIRKNEAEVPVRQFKYLESGKTLDNMVKRAITRISEKRVYVVCQPLNPKQLRNQDREFVNLVYSYPEEPSRGIVWSLVQAILFLEQQGFFYDRPDKKEIKQSIRPFYGLDNV